MVNLFTVRTINKFIIKFYNYQVFFYGQLEEKRAESYP